MPRQRLFQVSDMTQNFYKIIDCLDYIGVIASSQGLSHSISLSFSLFSYFFSIVVPLISLSGQITFTESQLQLAEKELADSFFHNKTSELSRPIVGQQTFLSAQNKGLNFH